MTPSAPSSDRLAVPADTGRRRRRRPLGWSTLLAGTALVVTGLPGFSAPQDGGRPDQIFRVNARGKVSKILGVVTENSLTQVTVERDDKESSYDSAEVVRIVWGSVPDTYRDGQTYAQRADWENAVARFRVTAEDGEARGVIRADARLQAAEALLSWGATDPNRFEECASECATFLAAHAESRGVPRAQWLQARATWLTGDAEAAAGLFKSLHDKATTGVVGYDRVMGLEAGLSAARASIAAKDTATARTLFSSLEGSLAQAAADLGAEDAAVGARLARLAGEASVGEGFCLLAAGQVGDAVRFFEGKQRDGVKDGNAGVRFAATLGLAQAYAANGDLRRAQIEFAKVSALEYADEDRIARAMLGLAEVTLQLGGADANSQAKTWASTVAELYGDTPAAAAAAALLKKL